jgi:hypothetical protein
MKRNTPFFSVEDRSTNSAIIMETETNIHFETLVRGEGEVDETREEFVERVCMRLDYLNR